MIGKGGVCEGMAWVVVEAVGAERARALFEHSWGRSRTVMCAVCIGAALCMQPAFKDLMRL